VNDQKEKVMLLENKNRRFGGRGIFTEEQEQ
jgi:hypothetical protein